MPSAIAMLDIPSARTLHRIGSAAALAALAACAASSSRSTRVATASEWRTLAQARPAPLEGAVRLTLAEFGLADSLPWPPEAAVPARLALTELSALGLLRRRDIHFIERRRFAAAAAAERFGPARSPGSPRAGVSPGAELTAGISWIRVSSGSASLEVRLTNTETGAVAGTRRVRLPGDADPVSIARAAVSGILSVLGELGQLPEWEDPIHSAAPEAHQPSGVPSWALSDFARGLAAEETWAWEPARRAYQAAMSGVAFVEAEAALARAARLRTGGTLGES